MAVTLIGECNAKEGFEFFFVGIPQSEQCQKCKLNGVCFNLAQGKYVIKAARDAKHPCPVHYIGVQAVDVEKIPIDAAIDEKQSNGSAVTFVPQQCKRAECVNYTICRPMGIEEGKQYTVVKVGESAECKEGKKLKKAMLQ
jgi:uncharacterized protein (UPF0179 family)